MSKTSELIFIPAPGAGHLASAVQLAKTLIHRSHRRISVTFLCLKSPIPSAINNYVDCLSLSFPDIRFLVQPPVAPSPPEFLAAASVETRVSLFIENHKPHLKSTITQLISESEHESCPSRVTGLVVDFFFTTLIDIGTELGVPTYIFMASNAAFLGLMLHLPILHTRFTAEFLDSETELTLPSYANPVPPTVLPSAILNKKDDAYNWFLYHGRRFTESSGIIVNTFAELEPFAINSFKPGSTPPAYPVGPILSLDPRETPLEPGQERVMRWLDKQDPGSVVVLCFGSMGRFPAEQVREIAVGLERSGHRFVWALRNPARIGGGGSPENNDAGAGSGLPEGFVERVGREGKGVVLEEEWLPQVEVLGHVAVGGFVSHCGWNSVLESLWFGVPIATLPMYAEQQLNAFKVVRELGVGVEIRMDYRMDGNGVLVGAEEVERGVRKVMEKESEVRRRVEEMKEKSRRAVVEGGSSFGVLGRLIEDIIEGKSAV